MHPIESESQQRGLDARIARSVRGACGRSVGPDPGNACGCAVDVRCMCGASPAHDAALSSASARGGVRARVGSMVPLAACAPVARSIDAGRPRAHRTCGARWCAFRSRQRAASAALRQIERRPEAAAFSSHIPPCERGSQPSRSSRGGSAIDACCVSRSAAPPARLARRLRLGRRDGLQVARLDAQHPASAETHFVAAAWLVEADGDGAEAVEGALLLEACTLAFGGACWPWGREADIGMCVCGMGAHHRVACARIMYACM